MYTVSWGQSRIINKTRRDLTQKLENLDQLESHKKPQISEAETASSSSSMSSPRPTFQSISGRNRTSNGRQHNHEHFNHEHQELIRFFNDSWERVCKEIEATRQNGHENRGAGVSYYKRTGGHPSLENFKPFDLEAYWGAKVYQNSTQSR